jgi:hypothetical protein
MPSFAILISPDSRLFGCRFQNHPPYLKVRLFFIFQCRISVVTCVPITVQLDVACASASHLARARAFAICAAAAVGVANAGEESDGQDVGL